MREQEEVVKVLIVFLLVGVTLIALSALSLVSDVTDDRAVVRLVFMLVFILAVYIYRH